MRKKIVLLFSLYLISALLSGCAGAALAQGTEPTAQAPLACPPCQPPSRTLTVNGSGKVYLTPDIAYVSIGVHTEGAAAAAAVAENNSSSQKVIDTLKGLGVADKDIQTTNFSISPQPQYDQNGKPTGEIRYIVENTVLVTARNLGLIGKLLDAVVKAGANTISGIQFDVADKSAALVEARKAAVTDARDKAEQLARAAGVTLGAVQTISEFTNYPSPAPVYAMKAMEVAAPSVPVQAGQMAITLEVNVVYAIQ